MSSIRSFWRRHWRLILVFAAVLAGWIALVQIANGGRELRGTENSVNALIEASQTGNLKSVTVCTDSGVVQWQQARPEPGSIPPGIGPFRSHTPNQSQAALMGEMREDASARGARPKFTEEQCNAPRWATVGHTVALASVWIAAFAAFYAFFFADISVSPIPTGSKTLWVGGILFFQVTALVWLFMRRPRDEVDLDVRKVRFRWLFAVFTAIMIAFLLAAL